jgi:NADPH:quinone reductase
MKAIVITGRGGPEVLEVRDVPTPEPGGEQIRVRVRACGVNRADLLQAKGLYPAPPGVPADVPGLEFAGEVDSLGPAAEGQAKVGDRVFGIVAGGAQAEFLLTHPRMVVTIPPHLGFEDAAAVPEAFITAHDGLVTQGKLTPGERVLVHAAGSGVGTAAVQIGRAMGCTVLGTSRTAEKLEKARALGLDVAIVNAEGAFADEVIRQTNGAGVDVILDLLGGKALAGNVAALANRGRLVVVGLLTGSKAEVDLGVFLAKRIAMVGTTLRARPLEEKIAAVRLFGAQVVPWLERGAVQPVVDAVFTIDDVREAYARMESNQGFGKVILRL